MDGFFSSFSLVHSLLKLIFAIVEGGEGKKLLLLLLRNLWEAICSVCVSNFILCRLQKKFREENLYKDHVMPGFEWRELSATFHLFKSDDMIIKLRREKVFD